ncbi:MAG: membrane associated rhomboid family serine protease [Cyclobacteriaceae bacterium]|jgi:membrane associated rhomboid family serine protease
MFQGSNILPPLRLVFLMWVVFTFQTLTGFDLGFLGILPWSISGLIGVLTAPLIHGNSSHLISNTLPLLFLGTTLFVFYKKHALLVFSQCYLMTNLLVWIFGREFYHIGASGLVYGIAFFLISIGIFKRKVISIMISIIVILLYGGLIYGLNPGNQSISWESHLFGAIVGIGIAYGITRADTKANKISNS